MRNLIFGLALAVCETAAVAATNAPVMAVRYYPFHQGQMHKYYSPSACFCAKLDESIAQEETRRWQAFFRPFGVTWPEGATVAHVGAVDKLRVRNTSENHAKIEKALDEVRREIEKDNPCPQCHMVEFEMRFVEVGQKALDELGLQLAAKKPAGARYDLSDFASVGAAELERALVSRRDLALNQSWKIVTLSGYEAVGKCVTEYIYPTDFALRPSCPTNGTQSATNGVMAVEPQSFTMREVGIILDVTPTVSDDGKQIDIKLNAQVVDEPTWRDLGYSLPAPGGTSYELPMEQPYFFVRSFDTQLTMFPGSTMRVGDSIRREKDGDDRMLFGFARAKTLDVKASK